MNTPEPRNREKSPLTPNEAARRHAMAGLRWRGWLKVVLLTMAVDQLLSALFLFAAQWLDLEVGQTPELIFGCVTCMLVSRWLVADARVAWENAKRDGLIGTAMDAAKGASLVIAAHCPKRWLVVLHLELNPQLALPE